MSVNPRGHRWAPSQARPSVPEEEAWSETPEPGGAASDSDLVRLQVIDPGSLGGSGTRALRRRQQRRQRRQLTVGLAVLALGVAGALLLLGVRRAGSSERARPAPPPRPTGAARIGVLRGGRSAAAAGRLGHLLATPRAVRRPAIPDRAFLRRAFSNRKVLSA